jgi:hypothetical protein
MVPAVCLLALPLLGPAIATRAVAVALPLLILCAFLIGLEYTSLLFLGTLLIAGLLALAGLRTYPRDVATAAASAKAISQAAANGGEEDRPAA